MSFPLLSLCLLFVHCHHSRAVFTPSDRIDLGPAPVFDEAIDSGASGEYPTQIFITEPEIAAPLSNFVQWDSRCDDGGLYFVAPRGWSVPNPGPMILDQRGNLLWTKHFDNDFGGQAYNFMTQSYRGEDYLTFWLGDDGVRGHGSGAYYMLNSSYDIVYRVDAANGLSADLHEFLITPEGTALLSIYDIIEQDLRQIDDFEHGDEPGFVWDGVFQEVDIATGELLFEWRASDYLEISTTMQRIGGSGTLEDPFDWFHINSVQKDELGNYLISARYPHSITYIDGSNGDILWTLGGKLNDFMDLTGGDALQFAWQHDARFIPSNAFPNLYSPPPPREGITTRLLSLFDNAAQGSDHSYGPDQSRGLLLEISYPTVEETSTGDAESPSVFLGKRDEEDWNAIKLALIDGTDDRYTVRVIQEFYNPNRVRSSSQGSMQVLLPSKAKEDARVLIGYGYAGVWTEFESDGSVLCDVHFAAAPTWEQGNVQSYRVFKLPWQGTPETAPAVVMTNNQTAMFVSWNGATEVTAWLVQWSESNDSDDDDSWNDFVQARKVGFETEISLPAISGGRYLRVLALDKDEYCLPFGVSRVFDRGMVATYFPRLHRMGTGAVWAVLLAAAGSVAWSLVGFGRLLSGLRSRRSACRLRWRKGMAYKLLGEA